MTITVALVDDQQLVRAGFRMLVDSQDDMVVVGEAGDGEEAVALCESTDVDVVLMDVRMPRLDGVQATRLVTALPRPPKVVVLTTFDLDEYVMDALRAGASAFLLKDAPPETLLSAVRDVHAGDAVVAPSATRRMLERFVLPEQPEAPGPDRAQVARVDTLTEREREVLVLVGRALSNTEIAAELVVAEPTVKTHVGRILAKTAARDRVQLVVLAYESGLLDD
ncbi:MAG: response regulator transcription factor [Nocardioidaceae bacterium]|nr:response regulator transcription factor [Nocardioidaceae bacterium]